MACFKPKWAWQSPSGLLSLSPLDNRPADLEIKCGKCEGCLADRSRDWGVRIYHESKYHDQCAFITWTYDDDNIPKDGKINKRDVQLVHKRMRKEIGPFRYVTVGEYGDKTGRPHYHSALFGSDFRDGSYEISSRLRGNPVCDRAWGKGRVDIGTLEPGSAMYIGGYVSKKLGHRDSFALQSRKPPIGKYWYQDNKDGLLRLGHVVIEGSVLPIPDAYMRWLKEDPDLQDRVDRLALKRIEEARSYRDQELRAKRSNLVARQNLKSAAI